MVVALEALMVATGECSTNVLRSIEAGDAWRKAAGWDTEVLSRGGKTSPVMVNAAHVLRIWR
jgi:hypothetical protein